ncbi:gibberellin-regulated protein 11-like [Ziziphus jujuba]|uniref:Gibberellin-regulated protein 11-like n=1 Tax=Ziziphus jujuba TaxID=326968 RepID=A0A6P4ADM3_ZIZJJ|nr:gibberellin-regulated protein 11-like [Ziziphus jujuba]
MAKTKTTLLFAILCFALILEIMDQMPSGGHFLVKAEDDHDDHDHDDQDHQNHGEKIDCKSKCEYRCSKTKRHKMCMRACNTCCERCNCVPPGTSGNEDVCPCYATMTTHGGKHKCP